MAGQSTQSRWDPLVLAGFFDDYERTLLNAVVRRCRIWWYVTSSPVSLGGRLDRPGPHRITTMLERLELFRTAGTSRDVHFDVAGVPGVELTIDERVK